jgi:hypothetical protein
MLEARSGLQPSRADGRKNEMLSYQDMKALRRSAGLTAIVGVLTTLAGCYTSPPPQHVVRTTTVVQEPASAVVTVQPPAPRTEMVPVSPGPQFVWDSGHWSWNGASYVWVDGRYVERPRTEAMWIAGHWTSRDGGWVWEDGHWG